MVSVVPTQTVPSGVALRRRQQASPSAPLPLGPVRTSGMFIKASLDEPQTELEGTRTWYQNVLLVAPHVPPAPTRFVLCFQCSVLEKRATAANELAPLCTLLMIRNIPDITRV